MKKTTLVLLAMLLPPIAAAQEDSGEDQIERAVEYRSGIMNVIGWNMKQMGEVIKGEKTYDKQAFAHWARELDSAAHLDVLAGFPDDSVSDESDAKDEIWLDWEKFTGKLDTMRKEAKTLAGVAENGDFAAIKTQFSTLGKACKGCHKAFRN